MREKQEWTDDISGAVGDEHHRTDRRLFGKASNIRRDHGESHRNTRRIGNKKVETK